MNSLQLLLRSTIGRKYLVALTGAILVGFVIVHMAGNLQIYGGPDLINHYGHFLKSNKLVLWSFRLFLLGTVCVHIWAAISLAVQNKKARPEAYQKPNTIQATLASVTMVITGSIILAFIIFHLLHFTTQTIDPSFQQLWTRIGDAGPLVPDIYTMMIKGFSNPFVSAFYILSMALLSFHLSHGIGSIFQTLGWRTKHTQVVTDNIGRVIAVVVFLGMSSIPAAILLGLVKPL